MKTTIYSITISIIYIPILFITIFVMGYVFFFISEYIYPFMLGVQVQDTSTWWGYLMKNLFVSFISALASVAFILHFYKSFNASVYIIPFVFTIIFIVMKFVGMGFNFDSITNLISSIAMFVAFIYFLEDESFR